MRRPWHPESDDIRRKATEYRPFEPMPVAPVQALQDHALAGEVKRKAHELGFDLVGIAPAAPSMYRDYFRHWLDAGRAGEMDYLERRFEERTDPAVYFPGAQSVICVALNYHMPLEAADESQRGRQGRVARYALGVDYHELIKQRLYDLADWLRETVPGARTRCGVDTAPVMEKELAARAGIGWVGKNTCVINPDMGSWIFLASIICSLPLDVDAPALDQCGTCTLCIDACPTQAIVGPGVLDATRCISYLTIELKGVIPEDHRHSLGSHVYGCDVCQEVCPWNASAPRSTDPAWQPRAAWDRVDLLTLARRSDEELTAALQGSPMTRTKVHGLRRNVAAALDNAQTAAEECR